MKSEVFQLDFSRIQVLLITIVPVIINFGIFIYVSLNIKRTLITGYFSMFVFLLGCWQLCEGFVRMSITREGVEEWFRMANIFALFVILFGVLFSIYYTKWDKKISWNVLFLFLVFPVLIFSFCIIAQLDEYVVVKSENWYWVVNPIPTLITSIILAWISIGGLFMLFLLIQYYFKKGKSLMETNQSRLMMIGLFVPVIIGIFSEVLFPLVFKLDAIPVTASLTTFLSIMSVIAIKKYHMLDYSPKHQWEDIVKTMNEGILIVDLDEKIKYANETFCDLVGYDFIEMQDKIATDFLVVDENMKMEMKKRVEARMKNISERYEIQFRTKKGEKKWLLVGGSPYYDKNGKVIGSIGIHSDITSRKRSEENLLASNSELEIFIYKASHDLRGPLASIIGLVNVSNFEIKDELSKEYMKMIGASTQKLDHTLKELVKTMKIKDTVRFDDRIDFKELIEAKLSEFQYFKGYENITISLNVSVEKDFYSNKFLLETIFQNLIENAIKYQNESQVQSFLKIDVVSDNNKIQIIFEDNGIGIKSSVQGLIFDMYYKAVESSKGSGLGLYLVKKCVEKLEGEIELRSFIGKGSTFVITLSDSCEI